MNIADAFKKLEEMHEGGMLTNVEFAAAKDAIITIDESIIEAQIEELKRQKAEIKHLDHDWQMEREEYIVFEKFGERTIPSRWGSIVNAIALVVFGICWVGVSVIFNAPIFLPLIGSLACVVGLVLCVSRYRIASAHDAAYGRYQRRREALLAHHDLINAPKQTGHGNFPQPH